MPSDPSQILHLGRDTDACVEHFDDIVATLGELPALAFGERPRKSPNNAAFINRRYCAQLRGNCTGEAEANLVQALLRMPSDRTINSKPLPPKSLSALWAYLNGRLYGRRKGYNFGADGCIGSFVAFAAKTTGNVGIEAYPPTPANYRNYSDRETPPQAAVAEGPEHRVIETRIIPSLDAAFDLVGAGLPVMIGAPVTEGFAHTDDSGRFQWLQGGVIGGHEFVFLDYDLDAGLVYFENSWANARWGALENHPEQAPECHGYSNIGHCTIEEFEQVANARAISSGQVQVVAINNVQGWAPKLRSATEAF